MSPKSRCILAALVGLDGCATATPPAATPPTAPPTTLRALYRLPRVEHLERERSALLLVDFQDEFVHGRLAIGDAPVAIARAAELLAWARANRLTVVHVRNVTKPGALLFAPEASTTAIVPELAPRADELVLEKPTGGAFTKTALDAELRSRGIDTLVIAGIMAHLALAMSAQDATVLGYRVLVAEDATTTRDLPTVDGATLKRASLAAIGDRFADVLPTREIRSLPITTFVSPPNLHH